MAHEMRLSLDRVNFYIGVAKLDTIVKRAEEIAKLKEKVKQALDSSSEMQSDRE
jgi:hypothetical protein